MKSKRRSKGEKSKKKKKKKKSSESGEEEEFEAVVSVEEETNPEESSDYGIGKRSKRNRTPRSAPDTPQAQSGILHHPRVFNL
jgi:hypothetical protein